MKKVRRVAEGDHGWQEAWLQNKPIIENEASLTTIQRVVYFALPTLLIIGALVAYKSSAALAVIGKVSATGVFIPRGNVIPLVGGSGAGVCYPNAELLFGHLGLCCATRMWG